MKNRTHWIAGLVLALLPLAGCGDLLDVDAPGTIADDDLNTENAISGLVVGMSYDLSEAYDNITQEIALASGELWHGGSYDFADIPRGVIKPEDVGTMWSSPQQARWVAEQGILRMQEDIPGFTTEEFNSDARVARAYLLAATANRLLGENMCSTVIDGGEEQPNTIHFPRAEDQLAEAIRIGNNAGADDVVAAAYGVRASVRAWQGDWAGAVTDAQALLDEGGADFVYYAKFQQPQPENDVAYETHSRQEFTVWNTLFAEHGDDPRVPWDTVFAEDGSIQTGNDGTTPFFQQQKYEDPADDIPIVKGTEMLVLQAEAALRSGAAGIPEAYALMNDARAEYGMDPLTEAATIEEAWDDLHYERGATTWIEARRLWDLRRWYEAGSSAPEYHPFLADRPEGRCVPISDEERRSNPNLTG
jgi:hypothetical protein